MSHTDDDATGRQVTACVAAKVLKGRLACAWFHILWITMSYAAVYGPFGRDMRTH